MTKIKMIIGLGNPIKKYQYTRHNIGAFLIYKICKNYSLNLEKNNKLQGYISILNIYNKQIILFIPNLYMNLNGIAIIKAMNFYKIKIHEVLIIHDELDLPVMNLKLRFGCGHNGHNGLKSIINFFKNKKNYYRLSLGIGRPKCCKIKIANYVLSFLKNNEKKIFLKTVIIGIQSILYFLKTKNLTKTQNFLKNLKL
ncbi:Peptidyl-tRNA hydrolase [Buchnera aphidicola (Drepanosiphum platanoidis)]